MTAKKLYIKTFGCQMNEYDSGRIADLLSDKGGYQRVNSPEEADLVVFNTCSVREKAQEKVFSDLGRVREIKKLRPHMKIAVGGCVASQEGRAIVQRAPYVNVVFGPQTLHRLPELLDKNARTGVSQVDISFPQIEKFDCLPSASSEAPAAFVSIMEGCNKYCSYCIVPYTRGEEISRPLKDVLVEVMDLAESGVKEVTLLGQNVNAYRGVTPDGEIADFALLLEYVAEIDGIERIRYTTSHPREFSKRLIEAYKEIPKLANHVHLPVQAGSDRVLAAMKRGYTVLEYKSIVRKLREARPGISIATDFIVGFPNETEEDFEKTMRLIEELKFDASFSFVYSRRPGTPAAEMHDPTPRSVKLERLQRLQDLNNKHAFEISQSMLGTNQRVLVTGKAKKGRGQLSARTDNNRIITFDGPESLIGQMIDLKVTDVYPHTLGGTLING